MSPQPGPRSPTPQEQLLQQNIRDLATIISSEARGANGTEQTAVGWTVVNRMKHQHATRVSAVWDDYSHSHSPSNASLQLATAILTGRISDNSRGATHFYSPMTMPKEGEPRAGYDTEGELESVPGVTEHGRPVRNYRPDWAVGGEEIKVPGVMEREFKFFQVR